MAQLPFKVTENFEDEICKYTGSPFAVCVDNLSSALYLCLVYEREFGKTDIFNQKITIPSRTYPSVPCEIINAGFMVDFKPCESEFLEGDYRLEPTNIWDSALLFTADMYVPNQTICLSFSGAFKNLKLGKGGCVLTDDIKFYEWLKRARNSGRGELSYNDDYFSIIGKNSYLLPEISARGLVLMSQFYDHEGNKISNKPLKIKYPDLSKFEVYKKESLLHKLYKENKRLKEDLTNHF